LVLISGEGELVVKSGNSLQSGGQVKVESKKDSIKSQDVDKAKLKKQETRK